MPSNAERLEKLSAKISLFLKRNGVKFFGDKDWETASMEWHLLRNYFKHYDFEYIDPLKSGATRHMSVFSQLKYMKIESYNRIEHKIIADFKYVYKKDFGIDD